MTNQPGEFSIWSSMVFDKTLFQYWNLRCTNQQCSSFQGKLANPHLAEAIVLNMITLQAEIAPNLWMPQVYAMAEGTTLSGELRRDGLLVIRVVGNTTDMASPFEIQIVAQPAAG